MPEIALSLIIPGNTPLENHLASSLDLMYRAVALNSAVSTLKLPYTYSMAKVPAPKQAARKQLGTMSADIVASMRDELLEEAVRRYLLSRGLTDEAVATIFGGGDGQSTTGVDPADVRDAERSREAICADKAAGHSILGSRELVSESRERAEGAKKELEQVGEVRKF